MRCVPLGSVGVEGVRVAVKANPWYKGGKTYDDPIGGLEPETVKEQLRASLANLRWGVRLEAGFGVREPFAD